MEMKNEAWKQWGSHTLSIILLFNSSQKQILKCLLLHQLWMGLLLEHAWVLETTCYKYKWKTFILLWINVCCGKTPWAEQEEILCPSDIDTSHWCDGLSHGAGDFFTSTSREVQLPEWSVVLFSLGGILRGKAGETSWCFGDCGIWNKLAILLLYRSTHQYCWAHCCWYSVAQSCPTLCDPVNCSTPSFPSPPPTARSNSCPLRQWCHPTISSSVIPFSSCLQSFPAWASFPVSQLFASDGQSIGASALVSAN